MQDLPTPGRRTFVSALIGNLHAVRWIASPAIADVQLVTSEVERASKLVVKKPLVCAAMIPADVVPPEDDVRGRMLDDLDRLLAVSESVHFVIEGTGFKHVLLRGVITGLVLGAGRRKRIFVHGTFEELLRSCAANLTLSEPSILATAGARGILGKT